MNDILVLQQYSDMGFFKVERASCDDDEYARYTGICDSYYFKVEITDHFQDLRFGHFSSHTQTKEIPIPHENILLRDGEVTGFLYDISNTPNGYGGYNGQIVFLLEEEGKQKSVGGFASVGCHSSFEECTLTRR